MRTHMRIQRGSIERHIYLLRGENVMLDFHLAQLYDVTTKVLVQTVKRNIRRFPSDFAFQITQREYTSLRSQIVTSNGGRGGRRYLPYAFTEQGIAMLASVPRSQQRSISVLQSYARS